MKRLLLIQDRTVHSAVSGAIFVALGAFTWACGGDVAVGNPGSSGGATNGSGGEQLINASSGGAVNDGLGGGSGDEDCSEVDAQVQSAYLSWKEQPNVWPDLAGKTFTGYLEGAVDDLQLTIDEAGRSRLTIGVQAAAPIKDSGYLCDGADCASLSPYSGIVGATYEIHGATYEAGRVRFSLGSPFDPWCALQEPVDGGESCVFDVLGPEGFRFQLDGALCEVGTKQVDCGWFFLAEKYVCQCTSQTCFAFAGEANNVDARLDANGDLVGTLWDHTLYLFEQE